MSQNYIPQLVFRGKPFITVSAKGISNGLSNTFNDGADFGPDTLLNATSPSQYGPPYSNTTGLQEALNYIVNLGGGKLYLKYGTYYVNQQINVYPTGEVYIDMEGEARPTIVINTCKNCTVSGAPSYAGFAFQFNSYSSTSENNSWIAMRNLKIYDQSVGESPIWIRGGYFATSTPNERIGRALIENVIIEDASPQSQAADRINVERLRDVYIKNVEIYAVNGVFGIEMADVYNFKLENAIITGVQAAVNVYSDSYYTDNVAIENLVAEADYQNTAGPGIVCLNSIDLSYPFRSFSIKNAIIRSGTNYNGAGIYAYMPTNNISVETPTFSNWSIENVVFEGQMASAIYMYGGLNVFMRNIYSRANSTGSPSTLFYLYADGNARMNIDAEGIHALNAGALLTLYLNMDDYAIGPIHADIRNYYFYQNNPLVQYQWAKPGVSGASFLKSLIKLRGIGELTLNDTLLNNLVSQLYSQYPSSNGPLTTLYAPNYSYTPPYKNYTFYDYLPQPSTPTVPSSGTALQNTNPYTVEVYLSGGSATQVQVTRAHNGTTYTVWSSSTATAIPSLTIRLNPGDSITLTYSTAPTWTWVTA